MPDHITGKASVNTYRILIGTEAIIIHDIYGPMHPSRPHFGKSNSGSFTLKSMTSTGVQTVVNVFDVSFNSHPTQWSTRFDSDRRRQRASLQGGSQNALRRNRVEHRDSERRHWGINA